MVPPGTGRLLSWRPINCDRWLALAAATAVADPYGSANLATAVARLRASWERLGSDLLDLFVPSGEPGTHAHHHYHAPIDPEQRERVLSACAADYDAALVFLDVALELSTRCTARAAGSKVDTWKALVKMAENPTGPLAAEVRERILYLQRTVLYARNFAVAHPLDQLGVVRFDNVGNITFCRMVERIDTDVVPQLDDFLHRLRPDIAEAHGVGQAIEPHLALTWIGSIAGTLNDADRKAFGDLRGALGFWLPGPYEVAPAVNAMVDDFAAMVPADDFSAIALHAHRGHDRETPEVLAAVPPTLPPIDRAAVEAAIDRGCQIGDDGDNVEAAACFRQALELDPENGVAHWLLAEALSQVDQFTESLQHFAVAEAVGVGGLPGGRSMQRTLFNAGAAAYRAGRFAEAASYYGLVVERSPVDAEARGHLAMALAREGRIDAALLQAARSHRDGADVAWARFEIGAVLCQAGNDDLALAHFDAAITLQPDWTEPYIHKALALIRGGRREEAVLLLHRARDLDPDEAHVRRILDRLARSDGP